MASENHRILTLIHFTFHSSIFLEKKGLTKDPASTSTPPFPYLSLPRTASGGTLKTRATMAAGGDDTRKMMGDPYALGGFVPDRDRHGIKYCNIEFGTGKVTTKVGFAGGVGSSMGYMGDEERDAAEYEIRMVLSEVELW